MAYKVISMDESGKASYEHLSKTFILSGVLILEKHRLKLFNRIKKLKIKYFENEEIVFHSRDMSRKKGPFSVLRNKKIEIAFWAEFLSIINDDGMSYIFIITDKTKAKKLGWAPKTILKKSYLRMLELFGINLSKDLSKGKIIAESDPSQDLYLIQAHNIHQSQNSKYRGLVTSLSLVSKMNQDPEIQIADALAPIAGMIFTNSKTKNRVETNKMKLIQRKLLNQANPSYMETLV